jgi:hypothetical protein
MPESPDIPENITAKIRSVIPYSLPSQEQSLPGQQADPDRNEPMPYQRPEGLLPIPGPNTERGFAVTPVPKSTSGTIGSFVGQVSVSPDTLLNGFPDDMDGQTPKILSVSDATEIYAHATVDGAGVVTARVVAAGASVPDDDPESGDFYWHLASVTMATDGADNVPVITVDQHRWGPIEELQRYYREFHIQPSGAYRAVVYNGTLFGSLPTGFSVDNNPFFELTGLASGDKIYAKVTYDGRVPANGGDSITARTIAAAAAVPTNNYLTGSRHFLLATVTGLDGDNVPIISQTRWGPIDTLRGTATSPYYMPPSGGDATTQTDYWDLTSTTKGADTNGDNLRPTYDSLELYTGSGFSRFVEVQGNLKAYVRTAVLNSMGQVTYVGPESEGVDFSPPRREFHIEPSSTYTVKIFNGTLFGSLPTGFSVNDSPFKTLTVANNDKIYAKVTWNRTLNVTGDIVSTITTRTIEAAAAVPANDPQAGTRHYQLATVTVDGGGVVTVSQTRWGPIDDLPGTALYNYSMNSASTTAQTDYWDLLATGKGKQAGGVTDLAPTYDSVQVAGYGGWARFIQDGTNLKIFARGTTMNSVGQITYIGPEYVAFNRPVVCETTVDVLVGLRLNGTELQGQYRTITVNAVATPSPEWVKLIDLTTSGTTIDVS